MRHKSLRGTDGVGYKTKGLSNKGAHALLFMDRKFKSIIPIFSKGDCLSCLKFGTIVNWFCCIQNIMTKLILSKMN